MLINSWAVALLMCSAAALFLVGISTVTAIRVLFFWDNSSDSEQQIELEGSTWLAAALIENGLMLQLLSLFLLVLAADDFSGMIAGAMCATGSFLANEYGVWSLYLKIAGVYLYGFWIVLHRLDICSENTPLIRIKFGYLLVLLPLLFADIICLILYLYNLSPDIITSCCGVVLSAERIRGNFLLLPVSSEMVVAVMYCVALFLSVYMMTASKNKSGGGGSFLLFSHLIITLLWLFLLIIALVSITIFFSSYIYALPFHHCPFDILQKEYNYIGIPIYLSLFGATFLGMSGAGVTVLHGYPGLAKPVSAYRRFAFKLSLALLVIFLALVTFPVLRYIFFGGEG